MKKMINKISVGIIFLLFLFIGCSPKQIDEYIIKGSISKAHDGEMVMLFTLLGDSIISVDTTIIQKGTFRFQGKEYVRDFSVITTGNFPEKVLSAELILERGEISVDLDSESAVSGQLLQPAYKCYVDSFSLLYKEIEKSFQITNGTIYAINDSAHAKASDVLMSYVLRVIKNNTNNIIGKRAFGYYCDRASDEELYNIYNLFDETTKSDPDIIFFLNDRNRARSESIASEKLLNTVFQDFEILSTDGTTKRISDFVGKSQYLFIDFWASWCGPCIADFPHLMDVYNLYHEKGLNVLGISFDTSETAWKKALETHRVNWEMVMAKNEREIRDTYAISGIPYGILLDNKGTIVEVKLRGSVLAFFLKKYLE
jgi:thiol-disulfide isomerase/thioredoxin